MSPNHYRRVVVTGIGCISPLGNSPEIMFRNLLGKIAFFLQNFDFLQSSRCICPQILENAFRNLPEFLNSPNADSTFKHQNSTLWDQIPCKIGAPVENFSPQQYTKLWKRMSRYTQMGYAASLEAMQDAGLLHFAGGEHDESPPKHSFKTKLEEFSIEPDRIGVCIGSGTTSLQEIAENYELIKAGKIGRISPFFVPKILGNITSGWVSIDLGIQGPNLSPVTACATGAHALGDSLETIRKGDADVMVAGGTESCLDPITFAGFCRLRALCTNRNEEPHVASRPFDKDRSGFVMGEGAGIVILEELEHARRRNAPIYGELSGYGKSGDAFHLTSPEVSGRGAYRAMTMALQDSLRHKFSLPQNPAIHKDTIQKSNEWKTLLNDLRHVNAHATATPMGDEIEYKAIERLNKNSETPIHVNSIKGAIGHCIGAAGSLESIATILSLKHQKVPGTLNFNDANFDYNPDSVSIVKEPTNLSFQHALSNSFGFGGTNVSLLFSRYNEEEQV